MRIRIRESFLPWIRDKHPGSAPLHIAYTWINRSSCRPHHFRMKILLIPATSFLVALPPSAILSNTASSCSSAVAQCFSHAAGLEPGFDAGRHLFLVGLLHILNRVQPVECLALSPRWPEVFPLSWRGLASHCFSACLNYSPQGSSAHESSTNPN